MREKRKKPKRKKEPFLTRMRNRLRETVNLGRLLVTQPRAFPGELGRLFKRFVRSLWHARGGGLYACGFVVTFLWLEATTVVDEVASATSLGAFLSEQLFEFLFRFTVQSLQNTIGAFLWPVYVLQMSPVWGGAILGALYILFPRYIKGPLTQWLFDGDGETDAAGPEETGQRELNPMARVAGRQVTSPESQSREPRLQHHEDDGRERRGEGDGAP